MRRLLGYENNLYTGFGDQVAAVELPYEEWSDVHNNDGHGIATPP